MNWEDECYLLSKRKFRENANIVNVFSKNKGKVSGIVYGGNSRKVRNYLQISNKIFVVHNSKNEDKIGYFKTELIKAISPNYFDDKKRTAALISICSLLNSLLPESQPNKNIYDSFEKFMQSIDTDNWIALYIFFEISLIKELGFDPNLNIFKKEILNSQDISNLSIDGYNYQIPNFLILRTAPRDLTGFLIKKALTFTRNIFLNKFYKVNNIILPNSRIIFENYFN